MGTRILRRAGHACVRAICAALALFALLGLARARAESDGTLRVRLARLGAPTEVTLRADCDYYLVGESGVRVPAGTELTVSAAGGRLALAYGGDSVALGPSATLSRDAAGSRGALFLSPALSNRMCGDLSFSASGDVVTAVLNLYIEDYLYGVVGCEMPPSCGLEALKAQAIVARGYALRQKAARSAAAYDLSDSGDALSFRGYNSAAEYADVIRAVDETRGQALYYGSELATCYFCESNGGQTESSANALGAALPYSQVMDDPYDLEGAGAKKTATLRRDGSDLDPRLVMALYEDMAGQLTRQGLVAEFEKVSIAAIEDIVPESPRFAEPSRLYRALAFTLSVTGEDSRGLPATALVTARVPTYGDLEDWYDLSINDEDNETVWVSHTDKVFEITFRRSGLGMGMSQRGAQAMARKGLDCETILEYYYPGTELRRLALADAARGDEGQAAAISAQPIASARLSQKSRLYDRADASAAALTTLPAGTTVAVYDVQGEWAAIGSGDLQGFIHAEALSSFSLAGVTVAQVRNETYAQVSAGVDILQLPVASAAVVGRLASGTSVRLNAYTDAWALITSPQGVEGFIPRNALTLQADGTAGEGGDIVSVPEPMYGLMTEDSGLYVNADDSIEPRRTLEKGVYVQILAYSSAWASVRATDGATGYVKLSGLSVVRELPEPAESPVEGGEVTILRDKPARYVSEDDLPLYESYSADSPVLATLQRGQRVVLGAYNDVWACVRVDGLTGFVPLSGLTDARPEQDAVEGGTVTVVKGERYAIVTADAPLYPSWSEEDAPLILLEAGTRVRLGAYNSLWACVRLDGVTGFMRVDALEVEK